MRLADLAGRRVVLLGVGIDVAAALPEVVAAKPAELFVVDSDVAHAAKELSAQSVDLPVFASLKDVPAAEVAVRSPGFPLYSEEVQSRVRGGLTTVTPLGLWLTERAGRPSVGVTGTKGKSTTAVLARHALAALGLDSDVLGNIGTPPWTSPPSSVAIAVLEVSSFQCADLPCAPAVAVLTALGHDHVDWHGSVERYLTDKARLFLAPVDGGSRWSGVLDDVATTGAFGDIEFQRVPAPSRIPLERNAYIAAAAALAAAGMSLDTVGEVAMTALRSFSGLPGRFDTVAVIDGVEYVDDALASNPLGVTAAIDAVAERPVTFIFGGRDRGVGWTDVFAALGRRRAPTVVICIDDGVALVDDLRAAISGEVETSGNLEQAVLRARELTAPRGVVSFSPGMPTPAAQGNWEARSTRFRQAVNQLEPTRG